MPISAKLQRRSSGKLLMNNAGKVSRFGSSNSACCCGSSGSAPTACPCNSAFTQFYGSTFLTTLSGVGGCKQARTTCPDLSQGCVDGWDFSYKLSTISGTWCVPWTFNGINPCRWFKNFPGTFNYSIFTNSCDCGATNSRPDCGFGIKRADFSVSPLYIQIDIYYVLAVPYLYDVSASIGQGGDTLDVFYWDFTGGAIAIPCGGSVTVPNLIGGFGGTAMITDTSC